MGDIYESYDIYNRQEEKPRVEGEEFTGSGQGQLDIGKTLRDQPRVREIKKIDRLRDELGYNLSYDQIGEINYLREIGTIDDEGANRIAATKFLSEKLRSVGIEMSDEDIYKNIDTITQSLFGNDPVNYGDNNFLPELGNRFTRGLLNLKSSYLAYRISGERSAGNDELAESLRKELDQTKDEIRRRQDFVDRPWYQDFVLSASETAPYMIAIGLGGAAGGTAGAFAVGTFLSYGSTYDQLIEKGTDEDLADRLALVNGAVNGAIEMWLWNPLSSMGGMPIIGKISTRVTQLLGIKGTYLNQAARWGLNTVIRTGGEILEEGAQSIADDAILVLAQSLKENGIDEEHFWPQLFPEYAKATGKTLSIAEYRKKAAQEMMAAIGPTLVFGAIGLPGEVRATIRESVDLRDAAISNPSKESFIKDNFDSPVVANLTEEQKREQLGNAYDSVSRQREREESKLAAEEAERLEALKDTPETRGPRPTEESPAPMRRQNDERLRVDLPEGILNDDGTETYTAAVRDPYDGATYMELDFRRDNDGTIIIDGDIRARRYLTDTEKGVGDFIKEIGYRFPGSRIEWNPASIEQRNIRDDLLANAPHTEDLGVNWFAAKSYDAGGYTRTVQRSQTIQDVGKMFNVNERDRNDFFDMLDRINGNFGLKTDDVFSSLVQVVGKEQARKNPEIARAIKEGLGNRSDAGGILFMKNGRIIPVNQAVKEFGDGLKAIIYASKRGNLSTLAHEYAHFTLAALVPNNQDIRNQVEEAYGKTIEDFNVSDHERFAEEFERYLRKGQARTPGLADVFRRIADALNKLVERFRYTKELSPELERVFDRLLQDAGSGAARAAETAKTAQKGPEGTKTYPGTKNGPEGPQRAASTLLRGISEGSVPANSGHYPGLGGRVDSGPVQAEGYDDIEAWVKTLPPEQRENYRRNKALNENRESLAKNDKKVKGRTDPNLIIDGVGAEDLEGLKAAARRAYPKIRETARSWAEAYGGEVRGRPVPEGMDPDTPMIKGDTRAKEKHEKEATPYNQMLDMVGFTVVVDDMATLLKMAGEVIPEDGIVRAKDRYLNPVKGSYRDFLLNIRTEDGFVGEIQLNIRQMFEAKETFGGHALYDATREFDTEIGEGKITQEQADKDRNVLLEISDKFYGKAYGLTLAESEANATSLDMTSPSFQAYVSKYGVGDKVLSSFTMNKLRPLLAKGWSRHQMKDSDGSSNDGTDFGSRGSSGETGLPSNVQTDLPSIDSTSGAAGLGEDLTNRNSGIVEAGASSSAKSATSVPSSTTIAENDEFVKGESDKILSQLAEENPVEALINRAGSMLEEFGDRETVVRELRELERLYPPESNQYQAPNGKPSLLIESLGEEKGRQAWYAVRTPSFKEWFGDWEKDPGNTSKVVDKNGEPLPVYHGARSLKKFDIFKDGENFFTDSRETAEVFRDEYAYKVTVNGTEHAIDSRTAEYIKDLVEPVEDIDWVIGLGNLMEDWVFEMTGKNRDEYAEELANILGLDGTGELSEVVLEKPDNELYATFLSIKDPKVKDYQGKTWGATGAIIEDDFDRSRDGFIATNLREGGLAAQTLSGEEMPVQNTYVTFSPAQIKSATDNAGTYSKENPSILFQLTQEEAEEQSLQFPTWQKWKEQAEVEDIFGLEAVWPDGMTGPERDAWFKATFDAAQAKKDQTAQTVSEGALTSSQIDDKLLNKWRDIENLEAWLTDLNKTRRETPYEGKAQDEEDAVIREQRAALRDRINREVHPAVLMAAQRAARGRELSTTKRRQVMTLLERGIAFYRDLYTEITGDPEFIRYAENEIQEDRFTETAGTSDFSIYQKQRLAKQLQNEDIRKKYETGRITEADVRKHIENLEEERKAVESKLRKAETELDEDRRRLREDEREIFEHRRDLARNEETLLHYEQEIVRLEEELATQKAKTGKVKAEERAKRITAYETRIEKLTAKARELRAEVRHAKAETKENISWVRAEEALAKDMALGRLRAELKSKDAARHAAERIIAERRRKIKAILKSPAANVWHTSREEIKAIQDAFLKEVNPTNQGKNVTWNGKPMTVVEFRQKVASGEIDIGLMDKRLRDRLNRIDINEITDSELDALLRERQSLEAEGKAIWKQKEARRQLKTEADIADVHESLNTIKAEGKTTAAKQMQKYLKAKTTQEAQAIRDQANSKFKEHWWEGWKDFNLFKLIDGWKEGKVFDLLRRQFLDAKRNKLTQADRRIGEVYEFIAKQQGIGVEKVQDYILGLQKKKVEVQGLGPDGKAQVLSIPQLMLMEIGLNNSYMNDAILFGKFLSGTERRAIEVMREQAAADDKALYERSKEQAQREAARLGETTFKRPMKETPGMDQVQQYVNDIRATKRALAMQAIKENLSESELALAAEIARNFSDNFPRIKEVFFEMFNQDVGNQKFYLPILRTTSQGTKTANQEKQEALNIGTVQVSVSADKGMMLDRENIAPEHQTPIELDIFKVFFNGVEREEHFAAFGPYIRRMNAIFKQDNYGAGAMQEDLSIMYGDWALKRIRETINIMAAPESARNQTAEGWLDMWTGNAALAEIGFNVASAIAQYPQSLAGFMEHVTPWELLGAAVKGISDPKTFKALVLEKSTAMRHRIINYSEEYVKRMKAEGKLSAAKIKLAEAAMKMQEIADWQTVSTGWYAVYSKELRKGAADEAAIAYADKVVYETQPDMEETELSPTFRSGKMARSIKRYGAPYNVVWNQITFGIPYAIKNGQIANIVRLYAAFGVANLLVAMMRGKFSDDDDDEEDKLRKAAYYLLASPLTGSVPLISDLTDWAAERIITGEKTYRYPKNLTPMGESAGRAIVELAEINKAADKEAAIKKAAWDVLTTGMYLTGLPANQARKIKQAFEEKDIRPVIGYRKQ
ncbi:MAG: hypothetical protein LBC31_06940 [Treponema sp.]|jgi:hypothetical protein|nr:hypothetical protein [Treponema sp.]